MQLETAFEGIGAGPVVAGAAAFAILLGVAGGESIDTTPLQRGKSLDQLVPDRQLASSDYGWQAANPNLPDRYPMETRNGRVEVWELRSYILRRAQPPAFDYYGGSADGAEIAAMDEAPAIPEDRAEPPGEVSDAVPGRLEHAALPIGDDAVLEPVNPTP